jgi:uncharacterized membrane protein YcaP (DUF421 family)
MGWFWTSWSDVGIAVARATLAFITVVAFTRITGLRSYAKMSSTDFITTLAIGSVTAATIMSLETSLVASLCALGALFAFQFLSAWSERYDTMERALNNQPVLLMAGRQMLHENMRRVNCTPGDVYGKLREANVAHADQILAVVFETTGEISVIHSDEDTVEFDLAFFAGVKDREKLKSLSERFQPTGSWTLE